MQMNYPPDVANNVAAQEIKSFTLPGVSAGTPLLEQPVGCIGPAPEGLAIGACRVSFGNSTVAASNSAYSTIIVSKRTNGGAAVPIASQSTQLTSAGGTGNWAAWTPVSIAIVAGAFVSPGDEITVQVTQTGGGVTTPAGFIEIFPSVN
jgi:hypothetical protein